jgi:hydrogenase nickel incorporation protein HypA/HybF
MQILYSRPRKARGIIGEKRKHHLTQGFQGVEIRSMLYWMVALSMLFRKNGQWKFEKSGVHPDKNALCMKCRLPRACLISFKMKWTLHIGQLSAIVPDSLSFCFEVITSGTNMEGARLQMEIIPLKARCLDCMKVFIIEDYAFHCIHCGSINLDMESGRDLSIMDMEVV